eukprot:TRINITY_DN3602_c0_g1_i1.p1 TRINITY_DN3602_c0_g1~~TRINITY_DN3602_c0_g1_i1.p1  ORF type:complete len:169 (-),score=31.86 TRINITY_DN3602_c0_g1_i1:341-847(-)
MEHSDSISYITTAEIYISYGDECLREKKYLDAFFWYKKVRKIFKINGERIYELKMIYNIIDILFIKFADPDATIYWKKKAIKIYRDIGDLNGESSEVSDIAEIIEKVIGDNKVAIDWLEYAVELDFGRDIQGLRQDYIALMEIYHKLGDKEKHDHYYDLIVNLKESYR